MIPRWLRALFAPRLPRHRIDDWRYSEEELAVYYATRCAARRPWMDDGPYLHAYHLATAGINSGVYEGTFNDTTPGGFARFIDYQEIRAQRDALREAVAGAHAIRCTCRPGARDPRCVELQGLAAPCTP
jgi:hypothetical protein